MPESTTTQDLGGLTGTDQEGTAEANVEGKPEGMTEDEWQEQLANRPTGPAPATPASGNVTPSQIQSHQS